LLNSYYLVSVFSNNPSTWKTTRTENLSKAIEFLIKEKETAPFSSMFHIEKIVNGVVEIGTRDLLMNLKEAKYGNS
jgi:hypothetical protein